MDRGGHREQPAVVVREYVAFTEPGCHAQYRKDAPIMAAKGYYPVSETPPQKIRFGPYMKTVTYRREQRAAAPPHEPTMPAAPLAGSTEATKRCPDCAEVILAAARLCRFCRHEFSPDDVSRARLTGATHGRSTPEETAEAILDVFGEDVFEEAYRGRDLRAAVARAKQQEREMKSRGLFAVFTESSAGDDWCEVVVTWAPRQAVEALKAAGVFEGFSMSLEDKEGRYRTY